MKKFFLSLAITFSFIQIASAELSNGVYRITDAAYKRAVVEDYLNSKVTSTTQGTSNKDWEQLWKVTNVSGTSYTIQNVFTGRYMCRNIYTSQQMTMKTTADNLTLATASYDGNGFTIQGSMYAHCAESQGYWLVGWNTPGAAANTFYFTEVEDVDIEEAHRVYEATFGEIAKASQYDTALQKYFSDRSCTALKTSWASDEALRSAMAADGLPTALQDMAVKVKNNSWATCEEHFRVQTYNIASTAENWNGYTRQSVQSNMKNPTGILANNRQLLYVMVEDPIPANARLAIQAHSGNGYVTGVGGTELHQGLNIVLVTSDANYFFMMYTCNSYNNGNFIDLTQIPPIKVHIEGGDVDGYYRKGDSEEVYNWLLANHKHEKIQLVSDYVMCHIFFDRDFKKSAYSTIDGGLESWDWVEKWQYSLMGFVDDKSDAITQEYITNGGYDPICQKYYNSIHLAFGDNSGFMDAGAWRTRYNVDWTGLLKMDGMMFSGPCSMWGAAHEIGHTNQAVFNMPGGTEVTNNLYANVVNFMTGYGASRGTNNIQIENNFNNNQPWYNYGIWDQTRMYFKLFLYYHAAKNKTNFFPILLESLRKDPLVWGSGYSTTNPCLGSNMHLKFYEKCCDAAQEDLTDFFEAYGFFVPMDLLLVGDYTNYYVTSTQEMIDAAKARVKAKKYKKNSAIIFIDDRSGEVAMGGLSKAKGKTGNKVHHGDFPTTARLGYDTGLFTRYMTDSLTTATGYTLEQDGRTINFKNGTGAQGFAIYDKDDKLIGFTNTNTFTFPETYSGSSVKIVAMGSNQESTQNIEGFDPTEAVSGALTKTMQTTKGYLDMEDKDGKHPGFYASSFLAELKSLYAQAETALANKETYKYNTLNKDLQEEIQRVQNDTEHRTPLSANKFYRFRNERFPTHYASQESDYIYARETPAETNTATWWRLYPTGTANQWRIACYNGKFINYIDQSKSITATATTEASGLVLKSTANSNGTFYFGKPEGGNTGIHHANDRADLVGWSNESNGSHWYLEEVQGEEITLKKDELKTLIEKNNALMNETATLTPLTLQGTNTEGEFYLFSNADHNNITGESDGGGIPALLDNNNNTFFHSLYKGSKVNEDHYLQANLGEGRAIQDFTISFVTRHNTANNKPTTIIVSGSNDKTEFTTITTFTDKDAANPLPNSTTVKSESWQSGNIHADKAYKYLRFTVSTTNTGQQCNNHVFFSLAAFNIEPQCPYITLKPEEYPNVKEEHIRNAYIAGSAAQTTFKANTATIEEVNTAYNNLKAAYLALKDHSMPEVTYEYYFNNVKKGEETMNITVGEAYPAPTFTVPYGVQAPTTPAGVTKGCETVRFDLQLIDGYPITFCTDINDAAWYSISMRSGNAHFNGTNYPENSNSPTTPDYCFAFVGDPWSFNILTPNNTYLYNSGGNKEQFTAKNKANATNFQLGEMTSGPFTYGKYYITIIGKTGSINDIDNSLGFWTDAQAHTKPGSQISFTKLNLDIYHVAFGSNAPSDVSVTYNGTTATPTSVNRAFVATSAITPSDLTFGDVQGFAVDATVDDKIINLIYTPYYSVTISTCGYTTFYAEEPTLIPDGCEAFYVGSFDGNLEKGILTLVAADTYVAARQGVLVKGEASTTHHFVQAVDASVEAPESNFLVGFATTQEPQSFEVGDGWFYFSTEGMFKKLETPSFALKAHKAYLYLRQATQAKSFVLDDATAIHDIDADVDIDVIYNLSGQRILTPKKGEIYIQGGKKVIF